MNVKRVVVASIIGASVITIAILIFGTGGSIIQSNQALAAPPPPIQNNGTLQRPNGPGGVGSTDGNSSLIMWMDANELNAINGATVTNWTDKSGNGHNFTNGNGATFVSNAQNGMAALEFNGSSNYFEHPFSSDLTPQDITLIAANKIYPSNKYKAVYSNRDDPSGSPTRGYILYSHPNSNQLRFWTGRQYSSWHQTNSQTNLSNVWASQAIRYNSSNSEKKIYIKGTLKNTQTSTVALNAQRPIRIGAGRNESSSPNYYFKGQMGEVIAYNEVLNSTQLLLIENYLASKYDYSIGSNELYTMDDASNGNYDHDVAGIGKVAAGDEHLDAQGSGIVRIQNPSSIDVGEFLFWGHDNDSLTLTNTSDIPTSINARVERIWRANEINTNNTPNADVGTISISFDASSFFTTGSNSLVLLIDTDDDGIFSDETEINGATDLGNGIYQFDSIAGIENGTMFTIGTSDASSLPIELGSFDALATEEGTVDVFWQTISERNNDYFTIERSQDGKYFENIGTVDGAGNSTNKIDYEFVDEDAPSGISYYRLRQTDFDGKTEVFEPVSVMISRASESIAIERLYPNPFSNEFTIEFSSEGGAPVTFTMQSMNGSIVHAEEITSHSSTNSYTFRQGNTIPPGTYLAILTSRNGQRVTKKIIKK